MKPLREDFYPYISASLRQQFIESYQYALWDRNSGTKRKHLRAGMGTKAMLHLALLGVPEEKIAERVKHLLDSEFEDTLLHRLKRYREEHAESPVGPTLGQTLELGEGVLKSAILRGYGNPFLNEPYSYPMFCAEAPLDAAFLCGLDSRAVGFLHFMVTGDVCESEIPTCMKRLGLQQDLLNAGAFLYDQAVRLHTEKAPGPDDEPEPWLYPVERAVGYLIQVTDPSRRFKAHEILKEIGHWAMKRSEESEWESWWLLLALDAWMATGTLDPNNEEKVLPGSIQDPEIIESIKKTAQAWFEKDLGWSSIRDSSAAALVAIGDTQLLSELGDKSFERFQSLARNDEAIAYGKQALAYYLAANDQEKIRRSLDWMIENIKPGKPNRWTRDWLVSNEVYFSLVVSPALDGDYREGLLKLAAFLKAKPGLEGTLRSIEDHLVGEPKPWQNDPSVPYQLLPQEVLHFANDYKAALKIFSEVPVVSRSERAERINEGWALYDAGESDKAIRAFVSARSKDSLLSVVELWKKNRKREIFRKSEILIRLYLAGLIEIHQ